MISRSLYPFVPVALISVVAAIYPEVHLAWYPRAAYFATLGVLTLVSLVATNKVGLAAEKAERDAAERARQIASYRDSLTADIKAGRGRPSASAYITESRERLLSEANAVATVLQMMSYSAKMRVRDGQTPKALVDQTLCEVFNDEYRERVLRCRDELEMRINDSRRFFIRSVVRDALEGRGVTALALDELAIYLLILAEAFGKLETTESATRLEGH